MGTQEIGHPRVAQVPLNDPHHGLPDLLRRLCPPYRFMIGNALSSSPWIFIGSIAMDDTNGARARPWYEVVQQTLKRNDVKLVTYVPDKVFIPLIKNLHADADFLTFPTAREEEALGIVSGAWMGGQRGAVLMQTSGFGTIPNVLASLVVPYQVPAIMFVSER